MLGRTVAPLLTLPAEGFCSETAWAIRVPLRLVAGIDETAKKG